MTILARFYTLKQFSLYIRSLTCVASFKKTRESIIILFNPILRTRNTSWKTIFIYTHIILFTNQYPGFDEKFDAIVDKLIEDSLYNEYITKATTRFREFEIFTTISNIAVLFEYNNLKYRVKSILRLTYKKTQIMKDTTSNSEPRNLYQFKYPSEKKTAFDFGTLTLSSYKIAFIFITRPSRLTSKIFEI